MTKDIKIVIKVDKETGALKVVEGELSKVSTRAKSASSALGGIKSKLLGFAGVAGVIYGIGKAIGFVVHSGWEYNKQLDASRAKLRAMISTSRGYTLVTGEEVSAKQRAIYINRELNSTMDLLKKANAQTAMGMSELIDVYALAKPGMDRYHWAMKDQIEILKLVTNTASNFGVSSEELATGIDDLAAGTWIASSGFGKMMKALGITNEEFKKTGDKVAYLKEKLKETGEAQDTWAVATSNLGVAWDDLTGKVTAPIFDIAKEGVKELTAYLNSVDSSSVDEVRDSLISVAKAGVMAGAYVKTFIDGLSLAYSVAKVGFSQFGVLAIKVMQGISNTSAKVINAIYGFWVDFGNKVRKIWHDIANYAANVWNDLLGSIGSTKFGKFIGEKMGFSFDKFKINIEPFKESKKEFVAEAKDFSNKLRYWQDSLNQGKLDEVSKINSLINKDNFKAADEFIAKIDKIADSYKKAGKTKDKALGTKGLVSKYKDLTGAIDKSGKAGSKAEKSAKKAHSDALKAAKAHTKELKAQQKEAEALAKSYKDIFSGGLESIFSGDISGGVSSIFGSITKKLTAPLVDSLSSSMGGWFSSLTSGLSPMMSGLIGGGLGMLPGLIGSIFSNKLSEAEIKAAAGQKEFDSKYFEDSTKIWAKYAGKGNTIAQRQLDRLRSMDAKFATVALALSSAQNGFRLDGKDMQSSKDSSWFGLSTSETTPLGSGIKVLTQSVEQLTNNIQAVGYQSYKETSSFFGFSSEDIVEDTRDLSPIMRNTLQSLVKDSFDSVADSLDVLGFDKSKFEEAIKHQVVEMGKINFREMSATEQSQALKGAIGEMLGNAVNGALAEFANPQALNQLQHLQRAGEDFTTTISRVAVGFDTLKTSLGYFGVAIDNFEISQSLIDAVGGLDKWQSAQDTFVREFLSAPEQKAYYGTMLQQALSVYNVALPASKAQFIALKKETEVKIASTKARIQTMKAEIAAQVAAGKMSLSAAYGELKAKGYMAQGVVDVTKGQIQANNAFIDSAHQAGEASIGFGVNVHNSIMAMAGKVVGAVKAGAQTAVDGAGNIDFSKITSPAIAAAEAELSNLEGLYSTLMNNMGSFSSYYGDSASASSSASSAESERNNKIREQIDLINKEIDYRNKLNKSIEDMQTSVYNSFSKTMGRDIPQIVDNLYSALNNKDYSKVSGLFGEYSSSLESKAKSKEEYLRGIIAVNADIQKIPHQDQMSLLDANLATEANTREIARIQRIATGLEKDKITSNERENKLDRNNKLLEELIKLQKEANKQNATGLEIKEAERRDAIASDYRARHGASA